MRWIQRGAEAPTALAQSGWLDEQDAAWLLGAKPGRMANLLRSIADQNIRDARANLRWAMAVLFPTVVILLGFCVLAYGAGLFSALSGLLNGLT
jgi:type II secretory pathway component PulF